MPPLTLTASRGTASAPALAVPVRRTDDGPELAAGAERLQSLGLDAAALLATLKAGGDAGEVHAVPVGRDGIDTVLLVGVGDESVGALRKAAAAAVRRASSAEALASTLTLGRDEQQIRAIAEASGLAGYSFAKIGDAKPKALQSVTFAVDHERSARAALDTATAVVAAVTRARDLINTPSLTKTPQWFADQAAAYAAASGLQTRVWDEQQLAADGFGGILAVGRASSRPPRLVQLSWTPRAAKTHVVLVGKGITFDSGGLSLKPLDGMKAMKTDMAGGAAVLATMTALRDLDVKARVTALIPLAENLVGDDANRPGDVIRHYGGRTVEVLNTDAEGRLVLADALAYARHRLSPDVMIDIATLTGAATLALGRRDAPLYSTDATVQAALVAAGEAAGERLWPMPLADDYRDSLDSPIADLRNIADPELGYSGGSIIAALFLREFVGNIPWAHLDIAGTGRADGDDGEISKGGTGFGVRTFLRYLTALG